MYLWTVDFNMVPETAIQGDEFLKKVGLVSWSKHPFVTRVSVARHAFSSFPKRTMLIEVTSLDELQSYLSSPERAEGRPNFEKYITNETNTIKEIMFHIDKVK